MHLFMRIAYLTVLLGVRRKYYLSNIQIEEYTKYALWKFTVSTTERIYPYIGGLMEGLDALCSNIVLNCLAQTKW